MLRQLRGSRASPLAGSLRTFSKKAHNQHQHHHAAGVHQERDKRKQSHSRKQEKTNASEQSAQNWNAGEPNVGAPSLRDADIVPHGEKSAQGQEHGCRACQHTHGTQNVQAKRSCAVSANERNGDESSRRLPGHPCLRTLGARSFHRLYSPMVRTTRNLAFPLIICA